jgi:uncharacterized protein (DUF2164 family)
MQRKFDTLSKEAEKKCIDEVITRIEEIDRDSEVGVIAAQDVIDTVKQNLGPEIYNMGLHDAKKLLQERLADLEAEIDLLEQHP